LFQIEVKLITASSYPAEISQGLDSESDEEGGEARQIQQMIYNLMVSILALNKCFTN
jgi:hypothetical protein